jgi:CubicO group peptidase (beta-lactamase class C family)
VKSLPAVVPPIFALLCSIIAIAFAQANQLQIKGQSNPTTTGRSVALPDAALSNQVDKLFAPWDKPDSPGCALAVVKDGRIIHSRGYGMADLEHDVPITPASAFYVGSLSKQFTAMAVALLAQQGTLSLDDDIHKYLPELPAYDKPITIRHLIHHTSGLPEYMPLLARAGWRPDAPFSNQDALQIVARERQLNFEPGEQFAYSNTGYTLLALIVERAAGVRLDEFADARIFSPLKMKDTHFHADATRLVKQRAYAYEPSPGGGLRLGPPVPTRVGAGGIFTTVEDLARWDQNFYDARVGGNALIKQLTTPGTLNSGRALEYAFGLEVRTYRGLRVVEHGGDFAGYHAYLARFPDQRLSVILLCNLGNINQVPLAHAVADIYLHF